MCIVSITIVFIITITILIIIFFLLHPSPLLRYPPVSINESTEVLGAAFQLPVSALLTGLPHVLVQVVMISFLQEEKHSKHITFTGNLFITSKARLTCCKCCASCFCLGARLKPPHLGAPLSLPSSFQEFLDCYLMLLAIMLTCQAAPTRLGGLDRDGVLAGCGVKNLR